MGKFTQLQQQYSAKRRKKDYLKESETFGHKLVFECIVCVFAPSGLEQCKARGDEADKDADNDDGSGAKDQLIKRKFPAMLGQAISVVGGYTEKTPEAAPTIKKLPEPILPVAQTK